MKLKDKKIINSEEMMKSAIDSVVHAYEYDCMCYPVKLSSVCNKDIENAKRLIESIGLYYNNALELYHKVEGENKKHAENILRALEKKRISLQNFLDNNKEELGKF